MSRFQGPAFRCDKIIVIVTLLEAIEGIPDEDYNFLGNDKFPNLYIACRTGVIFCDLLDNSRFIASIVLLCMG